MTPIKKTVLLAVLAGLAYGLLTRIAFRSNDRLFSVMSFAFIAIVPFGVGFVVAYVSERSGERNRFGLPVLVLLLVIGMAALLSWEGMICIVLFLPAGLLLCLFGGYVGSSAGRRDDAGNGPLACVAILPFLIAPLEHWTGPLQEVREVRTSIDIQASPDTVWRHIKRVRPILAGEHRYSWTQSIGFPKPVEATLSHEGVGGVRHATFERGLLFVETVTAWEPQRRLVFQIRADTAHIPPDTLDEHVTIGGPYFDALQGEYRIEPLPSGGVRLHLSSRHRLSTTFNFYAGLWTDAVMRDIQNNILHVIADRCEKAD